MQFLQVRVERANDVLAVATNVQLTALLVCCTAGKPRFRISSGTEDYFLGTFYFNKGQYFFPQAGVTSLCPPTTLGNPPSIDCAPAVTMSYHSLPSAVQ